MCLKCGSEDKECCCNEKFISVTGKQGPRGVQGPPGPAGPQGTPAPTFFNDDIRQTAGLFINLGNGNQNSVLDLFSGQSITIPTGQSGRYEVIMHHGSTQVAMITNEWVFSIRTKVNVTEISRSSYGLSIGVGGSGVPHQNFIPMTTVGYVDLVAGDVITGDVETGGMGASDLSVSSINGGLNAVLSVKRLS